jgi:predicted nucleic acid-binding Zn ribbon protein
MATTTKKTTPTSNRFTAAERRKIAAAARRRGLTPSAFIKKAALGQTEPTGDDARLDRLEALVEAARQAVEDEVDYRTVAAAWAKHVESGERLLSGEEVWRELGV